MGKCDDCKANLYPDNPSVGVSVRGHYYPPVCHGCSNFDYDQYLRVGNGCDDYSGKVEPPDYTTAVEINKHSDSLRGEFAYTRNKINEHIDMARKRVAPKPSGKGVKL